jgi:hypothetical protein
MKEFFETYPIAAWSIVSTMLALVVVASLWDKLRWWWHNTWYSFPLIGKLAKLSGDGNEDSSHKGWFKAERTLCRDYKKFIRIQDEHDFNEKITYLTKAGDNGRRETPAWIWLLTVAMVFVEAMGFSYVLAGYTLPGASENLQQTGAYGIAFLISVILVAFTHFAGHELYKSNQIKHARREWIEDGRSGKFSTGTVPLARPQSQDDNQSSYTQLVNRIGAHPSRAVTIATVIFVVAIALFATYVRGQVLEKQLQQQVTSQTSQTELSIKASASGLDMSVNTTGALPDADLKANRLADDKAASDEASIDRHGGWGTFIALAFVFVFLQILGVIFGYRWGFAGKNSAEAFRAIGKGRYATYADVREHYQEISDTAQGMLENLQQRMMEKNGRIGTKGHHATKTFREFMQEMRMEEVEDRSLERETTARIAAMHQQSVVMPPTQTAGTTDVAQALAHLKSLGTDKEAKKAYIATLPPELDEQVRAALKAEKEGETARRTREREAELEDLL